MNNNTSIAQQLIEVAKKYPNSDLTVIHANDELVEIQLNNNRFWLYVDRGVVSWYAVGEDGSSIEISEV